MSAGWLITIMPIVINKIFQSDRVDVLIGLIGNEPKEVIDWNHRYKNNFPYRVAFAINQHYPELQSGFYRNKNLIAMIQESLNNMALYVVIEDNYRKDAIVPGEIPGSLDISDDYILVDERLEIHGRLNVWESHGGKGQFYHDKFIMEALIDQKRGCELVRVFAEKCKLKSVASSMLTV
jgi:hypothetical protein